MNRRAGIDADAKLIEREVLRVQDLAPSWLLRMDAGRVKAQVSTKYYDEDVLAGRISWHGVLTLSPFFCAKLDDQALLALIAHEAHHYKLMRDGASSAEDELPRAVRVIERTIYCLWGISLAMTVSLVSLDNPWLQGLAAIGTFLAAAIATLPILLIVVGAVCYRWGANSSHDEEFACDDYAARIAGTDAIVKVVETGQYMQAPGLRLLSRWINMPSHPSPARRIRRLKANSRTAFIDASEKLEWAA